MRILFSIVWIFFILSTTTGQAPVDKEGLTLELRALRNEVQLVNSPDQSVIKARNNLRLNIADIIVRLDAFEGTFPGIYLTSLKKLTGFAHKVVISNDATEQIKLLERINWDLQIKFKERSNTLGSQFFNDLIDVTVTCTKNGKTANNFRIRYAALGYQVNTEQPDGSFGILTSPAKDKLIPGYYQVWVTEDGNFAVLRTWSGEISPDKNNMLQFDLQ